MSAPPKLKRLLPEDYDFESDATEWGPKLLQTLTTFCSDVTNAMTGGLERTINTRGEAWEVIFYTGASVAADASPWPLIIKPKTTRQPQHFWVTDPQDITDTSGLVPAGAVQPFWRRNADGDVVIRYFTGLDASRRYRIRGLME